MSKEWEEATKWEAEWWGNCVNTYGEEMKQFLYAEKMRLKTVHNGKTPFSFDLQGKSVLDIGCGPVSLLLKCENVIGTAIDPMFLPNWVIERYKTAGIEFKQLKAENISTKCEFDEIWIYNCLQHTENPEKIIENAIKVGKIIRIFEWIDLPVCEGHLHILTENNLNKWLNGEGKVEFVNKNNCKGKCYYGIFPTKI